MTDSVRPHGQTCPCSECEAFREPIGCMHEFECDRNGVLYCLRCKRLAGDMPLLTPLPPRSRHKKTRKQVEQSNVDTIISALNRMPGVWAIQNETRSVRTPKGWVSQQPLGVGSGDVLFSVDDLILDGCSIGSNVARIGWLEIKTTKTRTKRVDHAKRDDHQASWADAMRKKGHFVSHGIVTVDEAMAAVERCRAGQSR